MLSASDIAFYREQGYLVVPDVLDPTTLDTARREMARILDGARAVTTHTDMYDLERGHRPEDPRGAGLYVEGIDDTYFARIYQAKGNSFFYNQWGVIFHTPVTPAIFTAPSIFSGNFLRFLCERLR